MSAGPEYAKALERMPHKPPMRLLSHLVCANENGEYAAEAEIGADNPFLTPNGLERVALAEMMAQTFAAGACLHEADAARPGYLVGLRDLRFYGDAKLGDRLRIQVRLDTSLGAFMLIEGSVRRMDEEKTLLVEGQFRLFLPDQALQLHVVDGDTATKLHA